MSLSPKPLTQRLYEQSSQPPQVFGGTVSQPNVSFPSTTTTEKPALPKFQDLVIARLYNLKCDGDWLARREELVEQLGPLLELADELESNLRTIHEDQLTKELEVLRKQCRSQLKLVERLKSGLAQAELNMMNGAGEQEAALKQLQELGYLEDSGKHVPPYPTPAELDKWSDKVEAASELVRSANRTMVELVRLRNSAQLAVEPAETEMVRLAAQERRVRCELSGEPYTDLELGLAAGYDPFANGRQ